MSAPTGHTSRRKGAANPLLRSMRLKPVECPLRLRPVTETVTRMRKEAAQMPIAMDRMAAPRRDPKARNHKGTFVFSLNTSTRNFDLRVGGLRDGCGVE